MAEHKEYWETGDEQGTIKISEEVISSIAALAAADTDGVSSLSSNLKGELANILGKKHANRGVKVVLGDNDDVAIDVCILVKFGVGVAETAQAVQERAKNAVESMTGLKVTAVNICVAGISFDAPVAQEPAEE